MFKKFARVTSSTLLKLTLFGLAIISGAVMVFGNATAIKTALADSKIYDYAPDSLLESAKKATVKDGQEVPIDDPVIQAAAKEVFTPALLRSSLEQIIDGTYGWLNKETAEPQFRIDFTEPRQRLAERLGDYAANRYTGLPACSISQLRELQTSAVNPFTVPCQVPGLNVNAARQRVVSQVTSSNEIIGEPVITQDSFPKDENGQTPYTAFEQAPNILEKLRLTTWILGGVSLLLAIILLLSHDSRRAGVKHLFTILLGTGVFVLIGALLLGYAFGRMNSPDNGLNQNLDNNIRAALWAALSSLNVVLQKSIASIAAIYSAVGGVGLLIMHFAWPVKKSLLPDENRALTDADEPARNTPQPEDKPATPEDPQKPQQ